MKLRMESILPLLIGIPLFVSACTVSESYTVRSYQLDEGQRVKRLVQAAIVSDGAASVDPAVLSMFQGVAREFISHHHEYILLGAAVLSKGELADVRAKDGQAALPGATASYGGRAQPGAAIDRLCRADFDGKRPHGVLLSRFERLDLNAAADAVDLQVEARLIDCETGLLVWRALGANTYAAQDPDLEQTIRGYANRYGESTRPYVAGAFLLARKLFDSMPDPDLNEDDIIEKIEIDALVE
ncbi:MAG: MXAN_6521/LA_1396 family lipoprotein [bacterium]|nr:MXAN_6521/LA_1396 family lipoprotein [bacterium]